MKPQFKQIIIVLLSIFLLSCSADETNSETAVDSPVVIPPKNTVPTTPISNL